MALPRRFLSSSNSTNFPPPPPAAASSESDFIVILAALLCALICVVGLVLVARCAWIRRRVDTPPAPANRGLKKRVVRSLPKFTYGGDFASAGEGLAAECTICLAEYDDGDEIRVLPQCRHGFHVQCIDTWLGSHSSCPSCRQILVVARCRKCGCREIPPLPSAVPGRDSQFSLIV